MLGVALLSTCPYWISVNILGSPDNGIIILNYLALAGLGGIFLLITLVFSALSSQQVIAFVLSTVASLLLLSAGLPNVTGQLSAALPGGVIGWLQNLSLLDGYVSAMRGVFNLSDLIWGLLLAGVLFALGISALEGHRRNGSGRHFPWQMASFAALFLALPILKSPVQNLLSPARLDVTEDQLNTLSDGSAQLVRNLNEPVALTLFYSDAVGRDYPEIRTHAERVWALLDSFVRASKGKLSLQVVDPKPFSAGEDLAISTGIQSVPTEGLDPLYFGISGENLLDDQTAISFLSPERDSALEFEIASLIASLDSPSRPRIAILSGMPSLMQGAGDPTAARLRQTLETEFRIDWLTGTSLDIPDGIDALVIIAPGPVSYYTAYQIDQFLLRKGRVIFLTDPAPLVTGAPLVSARFADWMTRWGAAPSPDILTDSDLGLPITTPGPNGDRVERQPLYPGPGPANRPGDDFLVGNLKRPINFGASGWFDLSSVEGLSATPLILSGGNPSKIEAVDLGNKDLSPAGIRAISVPMTGPVAMGVRISGRFNTAFPDGAPAPELPDDPVLKRIAQSQIPDRKPIRSSAVQGEVVLIGDTDFLADAFYVNPQTGEPVADNEALLLSILDQFAGRPELASLRTRPAARRPMTRILELRARAEADYLEEQDRIEAELAQLEQALNGPLSAASAETRARYLESREGLRRLQRAFRSKIDALEAWLRVFTIWLPFALTILAGLLMHLVGRRSR